MNKTLYDRLQEKMETELERLKSTLTADGAQAVLNHAEELVVKAQIVRRLESAFLAEDQIKALLKMEQPLQYIFENDWNGNHSSVISLFSDLAYAAGENALKDQMAGQAAGKLGTSSNKYEITDIAHPEYPFLHRIRALRDIGTDVRRGDLGGYVQSEDNLSQQGGCWLFGNAIACEESLVSQDAQVSEHAVIRGSALVSGTALVSGNAVVEDHAIVMAGTVGANCFISGDACLAPNRQTNAAPSVAGQAAVYGKVYGSVLVSGSSVILPGIQIDMPTLDVLEIRDGKTCIHRIREKLQKASVRQTQKTRNSGVER